MRSIKKLEQFCRNLVLALPWGTDVNGAVVICYPEVPIPQFNHVADVNINEDKAENLLNKVTNHFVSKKSQSFWFRISPLTHPSSFSSFLEDHGFEKGEEGKLLSINWKPLLLL